MPPLLKVAPLAGYVACIVGANLLITHVGIVPVGFGLSAPAGVYLAGLAFTARDWTQETLGRWWTVGAIVLGAALSALLSPQLALASGVAFLLAEALDMAIYTPLRGRTFLGAVVASGLVGTVVDSALFLGLAFGSLEFLAGQVVGKWTMTLLAAGALFVLRRRLAPA